MSRGFIRERRPDVYELRAYVGYDARTGKRRWLHATFRGDRGDAEAALDDLVAQADAEAGRVAGLVRRPKVRSSITVADVCERWFDWAMPRLEPGSRVRTGSLHEKTSTATSSFASAMSSCGGYAVTSLPRTAIPTTTSAS